MDNVGEPILLLYGSGRVLDAKQSTGGLLGRTVDDLRGRTLTGRRARGSPVGLVWGEPARPAQLPSGWNDRRWFEPVPMATRESDGANEAQISSVM
ncbi:MAG: hypothetical protein ACC726_10070 [Chloroflexota bacterium]